MPEMQTAALRDSRILCLISASAANTETIGAALGRRLPPGAVVCLSGALGAGKTVFSRGIGAGWGAVPPLTSPTYNLVHQHRRARDDGQLAHIDLYRIGGTADADTLGLDDLLDSAYIVIMEWPERVGDLLPPAHLWIDIEWLNDDKRELVFRARGPRHAALLDALRRDLAAS
ncbi:MAG: tRNA (adenosine(37)-N6)-threonylcarbamoyltransferase complex ATPase subunit type 1 TsaE [Chloroflexi bacterium]|nr:tRNA (adenosine(37)-N6)-threonylcarbamoyltransferase complex ATPase subunit type 1 TsaE [Chloroflexota bacterium]